MHVAWEQYEINNHITGTDCAVAPIAGGAKTAILLPAD